MIQINTIYNTDFLNNNIKDNSVQLIIADPPYYKVKGEFDKAWDSFDAYLEDVGRWAAECQRIMAVNGTLIWFGDALNIAYSQVILDKYFNILNACVWRKTNHYNNRQPIGQARRFIATTERFLVYESKVDDSTCFEPLKQYLRAEREKFMQSKGMKTVSEFNNFANKTCGNTTVSRHCFADSQFELLSESNFNKLKQAGMFSRDYDDLRSKYLALKSEFYKSRRYFNFPSNDKISDVIDMPINTFVMKQYDHPTQKSDKLISLLINACSRPNDLVCVPFVGSGTECAMAQKYKRNFIGFEINPEYCDIANKRLDIVKSQTNLFLEDEL